MVLRSNSLFGKRPRIGRGVRLPAVGVELRLCFSRRPLPQRWFTAWLSARHNPCGGGSRWSSPVTPLAKHNHAVGGSNVGNVIDRSTCGNAVLVAGKMGRNPASRRPLPSLVEKGVLLHSRRWCLLWSMDNNDLLDGDRVSPSDIQIVLGVAVPIMKHRHRPFVTLDDRMLAAEQLVRVSLMSEAECAKSGIAL